MECIRHKKYEHAILEGVNYPKHYFHDHNEVAKILLSKRPYTVTVIIENLDFKLWRKKEYVKQIRIVRSSRYMELLYKKFHDEFGEADGNEIYSKWLDKYRPYWKQNNMKDDLDSYIIKNELEPRYKKIILKRFTDHSKLYKNRYYIKFERYYNLPEPLDYVDWRNPYDNIIVWHEGDQKYYVRGGSGSSGQRETNSVYLFGCALINQKTPVPSYLFIYDRKNTLWFIKRFPSLCIPDYDLGSNYNFSAKLRRKVLKGARLYSWEINDESIKKIEFTKSIY